MSGTSPQVLVRPATPADLLAMGGVAQRAYREAESSTLPRTWPDSPVPTRADHHSLAAGNDGNSCDLG